MTTISFSKLNSDEINYEELHFSPFSNHSISLFGKPKEIGHFSIDSGAKIHLDKSQMRYLITDLKSLDLNFDLNAGYSPNHSKQYVTIDKMYQLLKWLIHTNSELNVDFVTVRGTLTRIMCSPYTQEHYRNQWEICASKFNGVIYFSAIDTDVDLLENSTAFPKLHQFQSWGYKFEQYMTTAQIDGTPNLYIPNHEEYCIVLKNCLNSFSLLYQAEIDAVTPYYLPGPGSGDTSCYVELKTSKILSNSSEVHKFKSTKLLIWWAQSFLTGVPDIICGRRTSEGIVKSLDLYNVNNMPEKGYGHWSSEACLDFCDKFLKILKRTVVEDDPNIVYNFWYKGEGMVHCSKMVNPADRYKVIPDWYKEAISGS